MQLTLIAAIDRNFAIGKGNALPWHLPADLKRFKALTMGKPVLMGRKTAESLGRPLPGRRNLVLTRQGAAPLAEMESVASIEQARNAVEGVDELCVIGGGEIFNLTMPVASRMHLTWVDTRVTDADAFFPRFDADQWTITHRHPHPADAKHAFSFEFVDYVR
jgi:dihydrofolate reductase